MLLPKQVPPKWSFPTMHTCSCSGGTSYVSTWKVRSGQNMQGQMQQNTQPTNTVQLKQLATCHAHGIAHPVTFTGMPSSLKNQNMLRGSHAANPDDGTQDDGRTQQLIRPLPTAIPIVPSTVSPHPVSLFRMGTHTCCRCSRPLDYTICHTCCALGSSIPICFSLEPIGVHSRSCA